MAEHEPFFITLPSTEGITPELITDIRDMLEKFAPYDTRNDVISYQIDNLVPEVSLFIATLFATHDKGFMIFKNRNPRDLMDIPKDTFLINGGMIQWDETLTPEQARVVFIRVDEESKKLGCIDPQTGERLAIPFSYAHYLAVTRDGADQRDWLFQFAETSRRNQLILGTSVDRN